MPETTITYFYQPAKVNCDGNCKKAWGRNSRPKVHLAGEDEDDFYYLSDGELEAAPDDPGTYEGGCGKPSSSDEFPTKWCVRECERCAISSPGKYMLPLSLRDFYKRFYNIDEPDLLLVAKEAVKFIESLPIKTPELARRWQAAIERAEKGE